MANNFVLLAQKFCNDYFCDADLNQNQFLDKVHELMKNVHSMDEKLLLLNEVIRISKLYCNQVASGNNTTTSLDGQVWAN